MDRLLKDFAQALRQRRLSLGISQQKLAERAELQRSYIADVERSARSITLKSAWKLALCLETPLSVLIGHAENPSLGQTKNSSQTDK